MTSSTGVVLLVTHLERQGIPDLLQPILYKQRQTREGSEGSQGISYTVTLGDTQLQWHPDFRLYLSTSVPTFLQGNEGLMSQWKRIYCMFWFLYFAYETIDLKGILCHTLV